MRTLAVMFALSIPFIACAEDMQKYLSDTEDLVRQKEYKKALERHIWFHNHALEHDSGMSGVRLSFALMYWKQLGEVYPPALLAMQKIRDEKTAQIEGGEGKWGLFQDVVAINDSFGDEDKTVELFRILDEEQGDLAKQVWDIAKDALIEAEEYDLVRKYIGNPLREFLKIKSMYDMNRSMYDKQNFGEDFQVYNENNFVEESIRLIDVATALDDKNAAEEIREKALAILEDYRLRDARIKQ